MRAGSPGTIRIIIKIINVTPMALGMKVSIRRIMYAPICTYAPLAFAELVGKDLFSFEYTLIHKK